MGSALNDKQRFGEILVRAEVLDRATLDGILAELGDGAADLGEALVSRGAIDEGVMLQAISKALNLPSVGLEQARPDERALALVPRALCSEHLVLPIEVERSRTGEHLHLAMANPADVRAIKQVTRQARRRIRPLLASARAIRAAIDRFYGPAEASPPSAAAPPPRPSAPAAGMVRPAAPSSRPSSPIAARPSDPVAAPPARRSSPEPTSRNESTPRPASARATTALQRGIDADLLDALDHSARESVTGPSDLPRSGIDRSGEYGMVRRPRRVRPRTDQGNDMRASNPGPLPPLPPGLSDRRRRPERTTNRPEPRRRPGTSPPPQSLPTSRHAGEQLDDDLPTPFGVIDDRADDDRVDVRRLLDHFVADGDEGDEADEVLSGWLKRYGPAVGAPADRSFAALEQALGQTRSNTARLLVALVRHLARRGLVDLDELIAALEQ